ncbi:MAG: aldo/keto reductase [Oscillospiraceae bacterium]|nr:aldo/keto reductase [Oscillospiraceae bacterium]
MIYRTLPKSGAQISVIGLGGALEYGADGQEAEATIALAMEKGVNYFDLAMGDPAPFPAYGNAFQGSRSKVYLQMHFGANYKDGKYGWSIELEDVKRSMEWQLSAVKTDYIDIGFLHCIDEEADLNRALNDGLLQHITDLKNAGVVHHIGLSTHTPQIANKMLDTGAIDVLMFSINAAYDYNYGEYAIGRAEERANLYRRCEAQGVGITVMKPFAAGQLLSDQLSPFSRAMTIPQCIQYALDKPGVLSVLPGVRNRKELTAALSYLSAAPSERDYGHIAMFAPPDAQERCVYCNHCQPCPSGLDVGLINKYYDLARAGDTLAADHYRHLALRAGSCTGCGHCDSRCPFHVPQSGRMQEIRDYFGE